MFARSKHESMRLFGIVALVVAATLVNPAWAQKNRGGGGGGGGGGFGGGGGGFGGQNRQERGGGGNREERENRNNNRMDREEREERRQGGLGGNQRNRNEDDEDRPSRPGLNKQRDREEGEGPRNKQPGANKGWNWGEQSRLKNMDRFEERASKLAEKFGEDSPKFLRAMQREINLDPQMRKAFHDLGGDVKELNREARMAAKEQRYNRDDFVGGSFYIPGQSSHPDHQSVINYGFAPPIDLTPQQPGERGADGNALPPKKEEAPPNSFDILIPAADPRTNDVWDNAIESVIVESFRSLQSEVSPATLLTEQDVAFIREILQERKIAKSLAQDFDLQLATLTHSQLNPSYFRQKALEASLSKQDVELFIDRARFAVKMDELRQQLLWAPPTVVGRTLDELRTEYDKLAKKESLPKLRKFDTIRSRLLELAQIRDDLRATKDPQEYAPSVASRIRVIEVPGATNVRPRSIKKGVAIVKSEDGQFRIRTVPATDLVSFSSALVAASATETEAQAEPVVIHYAKGAGAMPVTIDDAKYDIEPGNMLDTKKDSVVISFPTGKNEPAEMKNTLTSGHWEFFYTEEDGWRIRSKQVKPVVIVNDSNAKSFHMIINGQATYLKPGEERPFPRGLLSVSFRQTDDSSKPAVSRSLTSGRYNVGIADGDSKIDLFREPTG